MLLFVNQYTLIVEKHDITTSHFQILPECDENPERTGRSGPPFLAPAQEEKTSNAPKIYIMFCL